MCLRVEGCYLGSIHYEMEMIKLHMSNINGTCNSKLDIISFVWRF